MTFRSMLLTCAAVLLTSSTAFTADAPVRGFPNSQAQSLAKLERSAREKSAASNVRAYLEHMARDPHIAGSPASKAVAEYAAKLMRSWGLEVAIETYEALLPYPTTRQLEIVTPTRQVLKLREPAVKEDPDSADANQVPTYNAYSASGDVTAPVVYVNYGVPEDYEQLARLGISVKGKIVLARYGRSWRGTKPKVAQEQGAVACLIYSDPRDDGYYQGDVYPTGAYRPPAGVQRGSVMDMPLHVGDPLTPGWASEPGGKRLQLTEAATLMKIPVLPISYEDAQPMLASMGGPVAPEPWRGALPLTYHVGPSSSTIRIKVDFDWTSKPLHNVIATIRGSVHPEEVVMWGNHHDAWVNGANDPLSGAAAVLEAARVLGELVKQGWKPGRTIKLALWDAEEFGLIGSTEFVEKHRSDLQENMVAYFNSDTNGKGPLSLGGSPVLERFLYEVARDLTDPVSKEPLVRQSAARGGQGEHARTPQFRIGALGAGSDYVAFVHHAGIASANIGFAGGSGGVYHSIYDSFNWYSKFGDPGFVYGKALADVIATSLIRMADAAIVPFEFTAVARSVKDWVSEIQKLKDGNKLKLDGVLAEAAQLKTAADEFEQALKKGGWETKSPSSLKPVNRLLYTTERLLAPAGGLPRREWYKHLLFAPGLYTGYSARTLPGIHEALIAGRIPEANEQAGVLASALVGLRQRISEATRQLQGL